MKYPIVLKYNYSYISSGNYYKEAVKILCKLDMKRLPLDSLRRTFF